MKWFRHDSTANNDAKLQDLILEYGAEGYGVYWYCLELIAGNVTPNNLTFELEHDARIIAKNLGLGRQRVEEIMAHMVSLGLFENVDGIVTCLKMSARSDDYTSKLIKAQVPEIQRVLSSPTKSDKNSLDKNRLDKNKKEKNRGFTPPTLPEIQSYITDKKYNVNADRFFNHYESNGWRVGRNKMVSWKSALSGWESRDKSEKPEKANNSVADISAEIDRLEREERERYGTSD